MDFNETLNKLNEIDLRGNLLPTGDPRYKRIFITNSDGCTIGRITILDGKYSHVKWYWKQYGDIIESDYYIFAWDVLLYQNRIMSENEFSDILEIAEKMRSMDIERKKIWRIENPKIGNNEKRKSITGKSIRSLVCQILNAKSKG